MDYTRLPSADLSVFKRQWEQDQEHDDLRYRYERRGGLWLLVTWVATVLCTFALTRSYYLWKLSSAASSANGIAAFDYNSPVYHDIDLHYDAFTPDGSLWSNGTNPWREDPSPEVDAIWKTLDKVNPILISESDVLQLGMPLRGAVRWPDDPTGRTYVARMDIFHLMHCVDEMRKGMWFDYYQHNETLNPAYWTHKKHCADIIRQELMCTGSLNLHLLVWSSHQKYPFPDFTIHRQCRRWEDILDWQEKHQIKDEDLSRLNAMRKPEDEYAYPMPAEGVQLVEEVGRWLKEHGIEE